MKMLYKFVSIAALSAVAALNLSCGDVDTFIPFPEAGGPAGVITGSVTYSGPMPCTENGLVVGAAIFLAFEEKLLPPPTGLGTSPAGLNVVTGEVLFSGVRDRLTFNEDGSRWCPPAGAAPVVVSAPYTVSPLTAGVYEIRGFYDLDGNFSPTFTVFNLPTAGDIGGGAIENAAQALQGAPVRYRRVPIGDLQPGGGRTIAATGARVDGVAVTLGLPLPLERPVFHVTQIIDEAFGNGNAQAIVIPSDYPLKVFSIGDPTGTEKSFVRLLLGAGVKPNEQAKASAKPFGFPADPVLFLSRQDVDQNGIIDANDTIPEAPVAALLPAAILTKLTAGNDLVAQSGPSIILQGITLKTDLLTTAAAPADLAEMGAEVLVALRPAVLCIDTSDDSKNAVLLNTRKTDSMGNDLVINPSVLEAKLTEQFLRPVTIQYGCLPQGRYALNLIYATGQAWTLPNEAGVCQPGEMPSKDGTSCGSRPRLSSQSVAITIGPPTDAAYCKDNPTPAACLPAPAADEG